MVNNTKATVTPVYGSTETCIVNYVIPLRHYWSAFYIHRTYGSLLEVEDSLSPSTLYEAVINQRKTATEG